jgi:signal transduction histidine kinase
MQPVTEGFPSRVAQRLRVERAELATRWLERLSAILPQDPNRVFPTDHLLDHIPELIGEIAGYLEQPAREEIAANAHVITKARELGILRYRQQASVHQLYREYRLFEGVLSAFIDEQLSEMPPGVDARTVAEVLSRVHQGISVLQQATVDAFIEQYSQRVATQRDQLEGFNRMVSHELRQPLAALQFAIRMLRAPDTEQTDVDRDRLVALLDRNIRRTVDLTQQLTRLSGLDPQRPNLQVQRVSLASIGREAARQLRDMADARGVALRVSDDLPEVATDVAAVELILVNLLSNAIKYSDARKAERFVEIDAAPVDQKSWALSVRDNGIGIPADVVSHVFDAHFRAHTDRDLDAAEGSLGLGLTIVKDCVRTIGGTITVTSDEGIGTTFTLRAPHTDVTK